MTPIEQVVEGANAVATVNLNLKAIRGAYVGAFNQATSVDLTFGIYGGDWNGINVAAATLTLIDDDTNYIVMDVSDGTFSTDVDLYDWDDDVNFKRICEIVVASAGFVENNIKDWRFSPGGLFYGAGGGGGGGGAGIVETVVAGNGIAVDSTDAENPVVNAGPLSINTQTSSYTLVLADAQKLIEMNSGSANNLTVPLNSSVAFPVGTQILCAQFGAGLTTIVATGGVTINSRDSLVDSAGQYAVWTLIKRATNTWYLSGDLA